MPRNIGTGLREFGGRIQDFGLMMLKSGIEERKVLEAQQALGEYEDWLRQQNIAEEEIEGELQKATDEFIDEATGGLEGELEAGRRQRIGEPAVPDTGLAMLKGVSPEQRAEQLARADVVSTEIAPGEKLTEMRRVPFAERTKGFQAAVGGEEAQRRRRAAMKRGVTAEQLRIAEERELGKISAEELARLSAEERRFKRGVKTKELELKEKDIERKRIYSEERNRIAQQKLEFDELAKTRDWRLDQDELEWKKSVKKEFSQITEANHAARKVKELRQLIKDGTEALRWNTEFFDIRQKQRGTGFWSGIKDVIDPVEQKEFNRQGLELKKRLDFYQKTMDSLIKRFNLTADMINRAEGFTGTPDLTKFQK